MIIFLGTSCEVPKFHYGPPRIAIMKFIRLPQMTVNVTIYAIMGLYCLGRRDIMEFMSEAQGP